jgi:UDP-N-acetylmuramate dehydrogenase
MQTRWCTIFEMTATEGENGGSNLRIRRDVSLAPLTTLELGGTAHAFADIADVSAAREAVRWAGRHDLPLAIIGGGSNVVVADRGFPGIALRIEMRGIQVDGEGERVRVTASAGEPWDELVAFTVDEGLAGLECLSGIPGCVGATPIQNVGAYGQEVSAVIEGVHVLDLTSMEERTIAREACGFGYRSSAFREFPGRFLVLSVTFQLQRGGRPRVEYGELRKALGIGRSTPSLAEVRSTVLGLRRVKSMVIEEGDPNRRSVGSFFVNPVVSADAATALEDFVRASEPFGGIESVPTFPVPDGNFKVSAAWLIEKAGFSKGLRRGAFGISTAHALALVHHGGGSAEELVALARDIREGVRRKFDIELQPEPVFLGFPTSNPLAP